MELRLHVTSKSTWKALERDTAKEIGGVRNGNRGAATADAENAHLVVECKSWSRPPARVVGALRQAELAARNGDKVPVARIHTLRKDKAGDLAVLRWSVLLDLMRMAGIAKGVEE